MRQLCAYVAMNPLLFLQYCGSFSWRHGGHAGRQGQNVLKDFTAVTTNTRPQRFFSSGSNLRFGGRQSTVTMVFHALPRADSFPVSRALGRTCPRLSRFCNILLQHPAQLHLKITRSTNLLSVCRRKLILSPYTHCKLQPNKLSQCTFATRLSSC